MFGSKSTTDYIFEGAKHRKIDTRKFSLDKEAEKFVTRLKLPISDQCTCAVWTQRAHQVVWDFVNRVHRSVYWYTRARQIEVRWYRAYMCLTVVAVLSVLAIAVLIPSAHVDKLFSVADAGERPIPTSATVSAQLTALIAGVYGVHRMASSWLFRRNHAHAFWKAASNLKSILYEIEEKWAGNVVLASDKIDPNFLLELEQSKEQVRAIIAAEEEAFFKSYESIKTDLQSTVSTSLTGSSGVVSMLSQPIIKKAVEEEKRRAQSKAAVDKARGNIIELRTKKISYTRSIAINKAKANILKPGSAKDAALAKLTVDKLLLPGINKQLIGAQAEYARLLDALISSDRRAIA